MFAAALLVAVARDHAIRVYRRQVGARPLGRRDDAELVGLHQKVVRPSREHAVNACLLRRETQLLLALVS